MRNAGLEEAQAGIKIAGRNINNLRYADDTILMAESKDPLQYSCLRNSMDRGIGQTIVHGVAKEPDMTW